MARSLAVMAAPWCANSVFRVNCTKAAGRASATTAMTLFGREIVGVPGGGSAESLFAIEEHEAGGEEQAPGGDDGDEGDEEGAPRSEVEEILE